ncbi:MAG: DUF4038 domain-containing protein [Planctomycetota bacterium]
MPEQNTSEPDPAAAMARRWQPISRSFSVPGSLLGEGVNLYADVSVDVAWRHTPTGRELTRPAYWCGGDRFAVRFASPEASGSWVWSVSLDGTPTGIKGTVGLTPGEPTDAFEAHGPLCMSPDGRSVTHHDGRAFLLVADTPWALPFRATPQTCRVYAADRRAKGFNAALLMVVQPDMRAEGPEDRKADGGFGRGFFDLPERELKRPNPEYFDRLDVLLDTLWDHGIVPVLQPVFQGFGWKGLGVAGCAVPPADYARFCRYLVARYGHRPVVYLVGGDGSGHESQVVAGGEAVQSCDAYGQPTGIHYGPNRVCDAHQSADWLDFQWCQTGHFGHHQPDRAAWLWHQQPAKGCANGEPTYERSDRASGDWQGHEAWSNLCAGGTMGVVYGAMGLWQWQHHGGEPGWPEQFCSPGLGWRDALDFPGSRQVGAVGRILSRYDTTGLTPDWTLTWGLPGLSKPDGISVIYLPQGGPINVLPEDIPRRYAVFRVADGACVDEGQLGVQQDTSPYRSVETPQGAHVVVFGP